MPTGSQAADVLLPSAQWRAPVPPSSADGPLHPSRTDHVVPTRGIPCHERELLFLFLPAAWDSTSETYLDPTYRAQPTREMSNVPLVVKLSVAATESVLMAAGVRDVLIPGTPLPLPGDDKLMLLWSSAMKRKQRIAAPVPPPQAFLAAMLGAFVLLSAAAKLAATFSHFEGTFLRCGRFK